MRIEAWRKNQKVERTSPGSKNKYKVTYWDGQEKWTSDYPGDGKGDRREKRLKEKKQTRPSIQDAKGKLNAAVKRYVDGEEGLDKIVGVVDSVVVHLGREIARETIGAWAKEHSDADGKAKEAVDAIRQRKMDKLRDKKASYGERLTRISMRVAYIDFKGWIDPHGKFYQLRGGETHEDFARKQLHWTKEGWASDQLWWQGWFRVVCSTMCEKALVAQSDSRTLNDVQIRELSELAISNGFPKVTMETGNHFRTVWENEDALIEASKRVSRIAGQVVKNLKIF